MWEMRGKKTRQREKKINLIFHMCVTLLALTIHQDKLGRPQGEYKYEKYMIIVLKTSNLVSVGATGRECKKTF